MNRVKCVDYMNGVGSMRPDGQFDSCCEQPPGHSNFDFDRPVSRALRRVDGVVPQHAIKPGGFISLPKSIPVASFAPEIRANVATTRRSGVKTYPLTGLGVSQAHSRGPSENGVRFPMVTGVPRGVGKAKRLTTDGRCPIAGLTVMVSLCSLPSSLKASSYLKGKMTKAEYKEYLKSEHWKELKARKFQQRRHRCGVCGSPEVQHHHLQYRNIYDVLTSDLRRLCGRCHKTAHELMNQGVLRVTSPNHHGMWAQTKTAVKKALGLKGNQFWPKP